MRSTKIAPLSLSTSYLTGSASLGISMTTLISSGTLLPVGTWSRPMGVGFLRRGGDEGERQEHQRGGRVAGAAERARDVAVVVRVAHRRGQDAVDEDRPAVLVDLVLDRLGVLGDLDDDVDFFGDVAAGGDVVEAHGGAVPAQGRRGLWAGCRGGRGVDRGILRRRVLHCSIGLPRVVPRLDGSITAGTTPFPYSPAN